MQRREEMQRSTPAPAAKAGPQPGYKRAGERRQVEMNVRERQEMREQEQQLSRRRFGKAWSPGIESLYGTKHQTGAPVLVIDGYNVLKLPAIAGRRVRRGGAGGFGRGAAANAAAAVAAPRLVPLSGDSGSDSDSGSGSSSGSEDEAPEMSAAEMQEERKRLEDRLRAYAVYVHARVVVVWDGMGYGGRAQWRGQGFDVVEQEDLTVVYTSGTEADTFIGRAAREFVARGAYHALVVTNDAEVHALAAAPGVFSVAADEFARRLVDAEANSRREQREARSRAEGLASARGTGVAAGVLAGLDVGGAGGDRPLQLQAMMAGFDNSEDFLHAEALGQTALEYYKGGRNRGAEGRALRDGGERSDHDRGGRRRGEALRREEIVQVDVEFAALKGLVDD